MFSLCESNTGYLWNSYVYLGKSYQPTPDELEWKKRLGKTGVPIVKLMKDLFNQGTALKKRLKVPQSAINERLEKGDHVFRCEGNLLMIRYLGKKEIYLLSTFHQANLARTRKTLRDGEPETCVA